MKRKNPLLQSVLPALLILFLFTAFLPLPVLAEESWPAGPEITAEGAILIDADTGTVLYEKNANRVYYPASTTKLLTALIAYEELELSDMVAFSEEAVHSVPADGSSIRIDTGESLSVEDTLYAVLTASANECANAIGEKISGSISAFGEKMTARAEELGCRHTHFVNPTGLYEDNHYTTPSDLSLIARAFFDVPLLTKMSGTLRYHIPPSATQPDDIWINNHNILINGELPIDATILGGKTGYTEAARASLVTCAEKDGLRLICVVMKAESPNQYHDTATLLNYGFANFYRGTIQGVTSQTPSSTPAFLESGATLLGAPVNTLSVTGGESIVLPKDADPADMQTTVIYRKTPEIVDDTDGRTAVIADILYSYNDRTVGQAELLSTKNQVVTIDPYSPDEGESASPLHPAATMPVKTEPEGRLTKFFSRYWELQNNTYYVNLPVLLRDLLILILALTAVLFLIAFLRSFNYGGRFFSRRMRWRFSRKKNRAGEIVYRDHRDSDVS